MRMTDQDDMLKGVLDESDELVVGKADIILIGMSSMFGSRMNL